MSTFLLRLRGSLAHWCRKMERPIGCVWTWDPSSGLVGNHRLFASAERPNPCNDENREGPDGICTVVVILASGSSSMSSSSSSCVVGCRLSVSRSLTASRGFSAARASGAICPGIVDFKKAGLWTALPMMPRPSEVGLGHVMSGTIGGAIGLANGFSVAKISPIFSPRSREDAAPLLGASLDRTVMEDDTKSGDVVDNAIKSSSARLCSFKWPGIRCLPKMTVELVLWRRSEWTSFIGDLFITRSWGSSFAFDELGGKATDRDGSKCRICADENPIEFEMVGKCGSVCLNVLLGADDEGKLGKLVVAFSFPFPLTASWGPESISRSKRSPLYDGAGLPDLLGRGTS